MKKNVLYTAIALSLSVSLAACSSGGTKGKETGNEAPPVKQRTGPVEINLVTPDATITEEFLQQLGKKFPDYIIKHYNQDRKGSTLDELLTVGTPIDIIGRAVGGFANEVIGSKLQYNMADLIKQYKIDLSQFEPQLVKYIQSISNGGMYGVPGGSAINHILFYNKSIFNQFGVPYPKDGMLWTEAMDIAAKLTRVDGGKQYYGFNGHTGIMATANQLGIPIVDKATNKPTINTDERWRSYFQIIYSNNALNEGYRNGKRAFSGSTSRLVGGDTAMLLFNANIAIITKELQEETIDWDMVSLPTFKEAPQTGSPMNSTIWGITSQTRDKEAAMDVISYMTSDEVLGKLARQGYLVAKQSDSILKSFASEAKPANKNWKAIIHNKFAAFPNKTTSDSEISTIQTKYIESIVKGEIDMNTAFRKIEEEALQVIEKNKK